ANQFIYWQQKNSAARIAPDVYVLPGVPQSRIIRSWKVWETGIVPSFCLEVVSHDHKKDYEDTPAIYAKLGVREVVIFDPEARERHGRFRWQIYRASRGRPFPSVETTNGTACARKRSAAGWSLSGKGTSSASGSQQVPAAITSCRPTRSARSTSGGRRRRSA